ncbi:MAG TPA: hypothetical protein VML50_16310, partial [Anaeromyxobacter sp.]|nr:hypothetical protein [Anaeromyxobacter sp.]
APALAPLPRLAPAPAVTAAAPAPAPASPPKANQARSYTLPEAPEPRPAGPSFTATPDPRHQGKARRHVSATQEAADYPEPQH